MHPLFTNRLYFASYAAAWLPIAAILTLALALPGKMHLGESAKMAIPITLVLAVLSLSAWFVARTLPLRSTPVWKLIVSQTLAAICASAMTLVFTHVWVVMLSRFSPGLEMRFMPSVPVVAGMSWLAYLLALLFWHLLITMESSQKTELVLRETVLKALKAQINPHFLFNSLNSISALTSTDPAKAREMCIRLSDFLRSSLSLEARNSISFAEELALTSSYLDVEKVRFGERLRVSQDFDPGCADCQVPPLLVQPLVENAIKHGVAMLSQGGEIVMTGHRSGHDLRITVENPFDPEAPIVRKSGFGLVNVRNRLEARYGPAARLEVQVKGLRYRVVLSLPCGDSHGRARV